MLALSGTDIGCYDPPRLLLVGLSIPEDLKHNNELPAAGTDQQTL
jgi:hypothetical protein